MRKEYGLPIIVKHQLRVVEFENISYIRTRDVSDVLGIKQPFEFNSDIKEALGAQVVLKGEFTVPLRDESDNPRTPYIRVAHMIRFLENGILYHKTNGMTKETIAVLNNYLNTAQGV